MPRIRPLPILLVIGLVLSACSGGVDTTPSPTSDPTPSATPSATAEPTDEPTATPTEEQTATPSPTSSELDGPVLPNAEADTLFLDRDDCTNDRDNYALSFPEAWFTNTEIGRNPACVWFSPTDYDVPDPSVVPDEIAITIEWMADPVERTDAEPVTEEELLVGGQAATRTEWDDESYTYVIQLGPPGEGPNLLVMTSTEMGGDYELNRAVMDRMMATIEFFGSTQ